MNIFRNRLAALATICCVGLAGCPSADDIEDIVDELDLDEIELVLNQQVGNIQVEDPRTLILPPELDDDGDTIIIDNSVTIISDVQDDIIIEELPNVTVLGFENLVGFDSYIRYAVDSEVQGIFVFDGESLLLQYPCIDEVELLSEEHFDTLTGELVEAFDFSGAFFLNPEDFQCGDAFIFTFEEDAIFAEVDLSLLVAE